MVFLTHNNKTFNFEEDILKISPYLEWLFKEREQEDEPLPLQNTTDEIFNIFTEWFNLLLIEEIAHQSDKFTIIYKPDFFKNFDVELLINIYNFALSNSIKILMDTVAYVIANKNIVINEDDQKYFILFDDSIITVSLPLIIHVLKTMPEDKFNEQEFVKHLVKQRLTVLPYANFEIKEEYIYKNDNIMNYETCIVPYYTKEIKNESEYEDMRLLKNIVLSDGVEKIADNNFYRCSNLTSINIPTTVTSIGKNAFENCYNLKNINIPSSVKVIKERAFLNTYRLTDVVMNDGLTSIEYYAFLGANLINLSIPDTVKNIEQGAFSNNLKLTHVDLPNGLTYIPGGMFYNCVELQHIKIPEDVKSVGNSAFNGCRKLTTVELPNSLIQIGIEAFNDCCNLTNINLPSNLTYIGKEAFDNCEQLTHIKLQNDLIQIDELAFNECTNLSRVELPNITSINKGIFYKCVSLIDINIPESVKEIKKCAFYGCMLNNDVRKQISRINMKAFCKKL